MTCTYNELLQSGIALLEASGVDTARLDGELLMMECLDKDRAFLFLHGEDPVSSRNEQCLRAWFERRSKGEPLQYITGKQEFMGLPFNISPDVLIPRQDTELLAELALEAAKDHTGRQLYSCTSVKYNYRILDMCCGSGALAVTMAYYLQSEPYISLEITAADISGEALKIAKQNAKQNGVIDRINFIKTDMFASLKTTGERGEQPLYDLIISNPPYISSDVIPTLQREVYEHEPLLALDGGTDGLKFYQILARESAEFLKPSGRLIMEIGYDQEHEVAFLLKEHMKYCDISVHRDLAGLPRVVIAKKCDGIE